MEAPVFDADWTKMLKRNVGTASVLLQAKMDGLCLPLHIIRGLQPGSMIEFSGEVMKSVRLTCGDEPTFVGRLGQSRGLFTVLLERPVTSPIEQ